MGLPRKLYLSATYPTSAGNKKKNLPTDVQLKLRDYAMHQAEYRNAPPQVDPYPIEKYSVHKDKHSILAKDIAKRKIKNDDDDKQEEDNKPMSFSSLPSYMQAKIKKILPHFKRLNLLDNYEEIEIKNILYDLFSRAAKLRSEHPQVLNSVLRTLNADPSVPRIYKQISFETEEGSPQHLKSSTPVRESRSKTKRSKSLPRKNYTSNKSWT